VPLSHERVKIASVDEGLLALTSNILEKLKNKSAVIIVSEPNLNPHEGTNLKIGKCDSICSLFGIVRTYMPGFRG
jgi:hypothetical protein